MNFDEWVQAMFAIYMLMAMSLYLALGGLFLEWREKRRNRKK